MNVAELNAAPRAASTARGTRPRRHPLLGGLLVKDRLINEVQLERVLALQGQAEPRPLLGQLLVDQKLVTAHELNVVLGKYRREHLLGDILVETNLVTSAQLETALASQRRTGVPLGETLIELGYITERQLKHALGLQLRIAFVDLDRRSIDPDLSALISARYARRHRVVPIAKTDDRIILAMDDPTDADVVIELRACTGLPIESVATTSDAMGRALTRLYGEPADAGPVGRDAEVRTRPDRPDRPGPETAGLEPAPATAGGRAPRPDAVPRERPAAAADGLRARLDSLRQRAGSWHRQMDAVETGLYEREAKRVEIDRLVADLHESRAALARSGQELEAKASALARMETAHRDLVLRNQVLERSLSRLQQQHDALLRDYVFALERVAAALERLRS
jgi:hypothetical protein